MGKRGPAPKPTKLKVLEGNPGKRPLNQNEPEFKEADFTCPDNINEYGQQAWDHLYPVLSEKGLLTQADRIMFEQLCYWYGIFRKCHDDLEANGSDYYERYDENGYLSYAAQHPAAIRQREASNKLITLSGHFGLSPSGRSSIGLGNGQNAGGGDPWSWMANGSSGSPEIRTTKA